jgi:hypothetical protein
MIHANLRRPRQLPRKSLSPDPSGYTPRRSACAAPQPELSDSVRSAWRPLLTELSGPVWSGVIGRQVYFQSQGRLAAFMNSSLQKKGAFSSWLASEGVTRTPLLDKLMRS